MAMRKRPHMKVGQVGATIASFADTSSDNKDCQFTSMWMCSKRRSKIKNLLPLSDGMKNCIAIVGRSSLGLQKQRKTL